MIEEILPPEVVAVDTFEDAHGAVLLPEEERLLAGFTDDRRRREFVTARVCARTALTRIGFPRFPVLPGTRGAPEWPSGVVGSITHCDGYRASVVARDSDIASIGIDAEPHEPVPGEVVGVVLREEERDQLTGLRMAAPDVCWERLFFSAKESVYKAWFPLTGKWLDYGEVSLTDVSNGAFTAQLLVSGPVPDNRALSAFRGRWLVRRGLVLTSIVLPARSRSGAGEQDNERASALDRV